MILWRRAGFVVAPLTADGHLWGHDPSSGRWWRPAGLRATRCMRTLSTLRVWIPYGQGRLGEVPDFFGVTLPVRHRDGVLPISNPAGPKLLSALELACGSHTATAAGVDDGDLIVYGNISSAGGCTGGVAAGDFMDVIAVPLDNPAEASLIHREPLAGPTTAVTPGCHDAAVRVRVRHHTRAQCVPGQPQNHRRRHQARPVEPSYTGLLAQRVRSASITHQGPNQTSSGPFVCNAQRRRRSIRWRNRRAPSR